MEDMKCLNCGNHFFGIKRKFCTPKCCRIYRYRTKKGLIKEYQINHLKDTNYKSEKNYMQRKIRYIKRRTRQIYSLEGHNCEFCGNPATERHHNTKPIEVDKFNYVCHECHQFQNKLKKQEVKRKCQ